MNFILQVCYFQVKYITRKSFHFRTSCVNKADVDLPRYGQAVTFLRDIPAARGKTGELAAKELAPANKLPAPAPPKQTQTIIITQPAGVTLSLEDLKVIGDATGHSGLGDKLQMAEKRIVTVRVCLILNEYHFKKDND